MQDGILYKLVKLQDASGAWVAFSKTHLHVTSALVGEVNSQRARGHIRSQ